jgi:hypothetical protein
MMRKLLARYMIPEPLVNVIVTMYTDRNGKIKAKLGVDPSPVLFLFAIQAAAVSMHEKWGFHKTDLSVSSNIYTDKRDKDTKGQRPLDFNKFFYADDAAFIFLSR